QGDDQAPAHRGGPQADAKREEPEDHGHEHFHAERQGQGHGDQGIHAQALRHCDRPGSSAPAAGPVGASGYTSRVQRICGLVLAALGLLVAAQGAAGHGQTHSTGYVSSFSVLKPSVLGVLVNVYGPDDFLRISNYSGKTLVVLGYAREPYLRFTRSAVYENTV